jgi:hypothetical protein
MLQNLNKEKIFLAPLIVKKYVKNVQYKNVRSLKKTTEESEREKKTNA